MGNCHVQGTMWRGATLLRTYALLDTITPMYISNTCQPDCVDMERDQGCREHPAKTGTEPSFPNVYICLASWDFISWRKKKFNQNYHFTWIISISFRQTIHYQRRKQGRRKEFSFRPISRKYLHKLPSYSIKYHKRGGLKQQQCFLS